MKAVITAAGLGRRSGLDGKMRKEMLPIYDYRDGRLVLRPIIDVIISNFHSHGISEVAVVLDPDDRWTREYIRIEFPEVTILFQNEKKGFGHAVLMARDFVGDDDLILNAGDGLVLREDILPMMMDSACDVFLVLMQVPDPEKYGTAEIVQKEGRDQVRRLVEKAANPPSNFALCAFYRLPSRIFAFLDEEDGENVELTPAINRLISEGTKTEAMVIEKKEWVSVGRAESYVSVLQTTLDRCSEKTTL